MALERYQITVEPQRFGNHLQTVYHIRIDANGESFNVMKTTLELPSYMSEIELISRMTQQLIQSLKDKFDNTLEEKKAL